MDTGPEHEPLETYTLDQNLWPVSAPPQLPLPPPPRRSGIATFWNHPAVIVGILGTLVLLVTSLTAITIITLKSRRPLAPSTASTPVTATHSPATATNSPAGAPTTAAAGVVVPEPAVFLSGHLSLQQFLGNQDHADLDTAKVSKYPDSNTKPDIVITETSLNAESQTKIHKWTGTGKPTATTCTAGNPQWAATAHVSILAEGVSLCVQTSDARPGALTLTKVTKDDSGQLTGVDFDYTIWKKPGDQ